MYFPPDSSFDIRRKRNFQFCKFNENEFLVRFQTNKRIDISRKNELIPSFFFVFNCWKTCLKSPECRSFLLEGTL